MNNYYQKTIQEVQELENNLRDTQDILRNSWLNWVIRVINAIYERSDQ